MSSAIQPLLVLGRYALFDALGQGGMATVHLAQQTGGLGFTRLVAIKRLHPQLASLSEFVAMFLDEARLAARIRHPNVVETVDLIEHSNEILIVMEYVEGCSLSTLAKLSRRAGMRLPMSVASAIVVQLLRGLHAAHVASDRDGTPLGVVHRDVSPHNVLVGIDGVARVLDFGIAKANGRLHSTRSGELKGKIAYMAPEQLRDGATTASDIYAAGVVLFEALAGRRPFSADTETALMMKILEGGAPFLSDVDPGIPTKLAAVAARALSFDPEARFGSAAEMAATLEQAYPIASADEVAAVLKKFAAKELSEQRNLVERIEQRARDFDYEAVEGVLETKARTESLIRSAPTKPVRLPTVSRDAREATKTAVAPVGESRRPFAKLLIGLVVTALVGLVVARALRAVDAAASSGLQIAAMTTSTLGIASTRPLASEVPPLEREAPPQPTSTALTVASPTVQAKVLGALPPKASSAPTAVPTESCDPPYFLDERGIQRVKRGCLKVIP